MSMHKKFQKVLALAAAGILALGLAGCGGQQAAKDGGKGGDKKAIVWPPGYGQAVLLHR